MQSNLGVQLKQKILVIEDEGLLRKNLKILLEMANYEVVTACNGEEGLQKFFLSTPDLILCDITMPVKDGYEVIKYFSDNDLLQLIPFIFLTAKGEYQELRKGMELGADDYIVKPFDYEDLFKSIKIRLDKYRKLKEYASDKALQRGNEFKTAKIRITSGTHSVRIEAEKIVCVLAERQYSKIIVEGGKDYLIKRALNKWEEILPGKTFVRIHRSTLINKEFITRVEETKANQKRVFLKNIATGFDVSRRYCKNCDGIY
jgi:DNA-binding LytR/AlgR family response regulator